MLEGFCFCGVAVGRDDRLTFVPIGKLIGVVAAADLAGFAGGDEHDGGVPIREIGDEAHGGAVAFRGGADAVACAGLRFAGNAEEIFQKTFAADGMKHVERVEFSPFPFAHLLGLRLFREHGDGAVGGGGEEFVVVLVGRREPLCGAVGEDFLEEGSAAPGVEAGVFGEIGLEDEIESGAASHDDEGDEGRVGVGDAVEVFEASYQFFCTWIGGLKFFRGRGHLFGEKSVGEAVGVGLDFEHVHGAEIGLVVEEIVDARGAVGLFPAVGEIRFVAGADDARVGGDDEAALGIESLRKLFERDVAGPFVIVCVAGDGNFAVAFFADGDAGCHEVADVAVDVRVDGVLAGAPDALHDFAKFVPIFRGGEPVVGVAEAAGFEGGPFEGVGFAGFFVNDGAVARDDDFEMFVGLAFDVDGFVEDLGFRPFAVDLIFVGCGGIEFFDVEVLDVGAVVGEAPGDAIVVSDDDERRAGKSETFCVEIGSGEMNFVPDGRDGKFEMGVVGEKRFAGGGVGAAHDPVVAAEAFANFALCFFEIAFDGRPEGGGDVGEAFGCTDGGGRLFANC